MKKCIVAQSGGPTPVINSSLCGVISQASESKYYDKVYGGLNGIEGILNEKITELSQLSGSDIDRLKYTPASALGSCRYKLKNISDNNEEYDKFFTIMDKFDIDDFFYIGGNDSMDTVSKLSSYAKEHSISKNIIGIPKTIDNDLMITDHCPGYGSAAKFIAMSVLETYLDSSVYSDNGVFILETMGRDTGWLSASAAMAQINDENVVDYLYLPEKAFNIDNFLQDIEKKYKEKKHVYVVVSEGIKDANGNFVAQMNSAIQHDKFGHAQLGGAASFLSSLIKKHKITRRVKSLELGVLQRCGMHISSSTDVEEAFKAGVSAVNYASEGSTGSMVYMKRLSDDPYEIKFALTDVNNVCNKVKYFPANWINDRGNFINEDALSYIKPLISDNNSINLPNYFCIDKSNLIIGC
ncbi:6-phosphofructokinase [Clostridium sp. 19966]|uniref:6-phosphofructokinase n=1 Tax=Clostridium sp. 19966 TaxID=2768166 RepID=UPI0028DE1B93|nr:6-phosphofructokinase [Clostridium sp. 19966]MDT8719110.1 6-phosphofructokinase [Clostridium sp. 19966]